MHNKYSRLTEIHRQYCARPGRVSRGPYCRRQHGSPTETPRLEEEEAVGEEGNRGVEVEEGNIRPPPPSSSSSFATARGKLRSVHAAGC
jgi:hypothetical protein